MYTTFQQVCRQLNEQSITTFKRNREIGGIVETVDKRFGDAYLKRIEEFPESQQIHWERVVSFNGVGSPFMETFVINGQPTLLSPTTLRYVYYALDILTYIQKSEMNKDEVDIIEIGGGYGFQSILLYEFAPFFDISFRSYVIVDLPETNHLQSLYLSACDSVPVNNIQLVSFYSVNETMFQKNPNAFLLSNYALGEFPRSIQDFYVETIARKTQHGYMCWNFSQGNPEIHPYFFTVASSNDWIEENPQTNCPPIKSYIVTY